MQTNQDALARAYAALSSLRKNIDSKIVAYRVPETYVQEYHWMRDKLENIGIDVSEFRVPDSMVKPVNLSIVVGKERYSEEKYVEKPFFLAKIDAILGYFEIVFQEKPRSIGFTKPHER